MYTNEASPVVLSNLVVSESSGELGKLKGPVLSYFNQPDTMAALLAIQVIVMHIQV